MNELAPVGYSGNVTLFRTGSMPIVDSGTLGRMMYPAAKDPAKRIQNVYLRNKDHFSGRDTILLRVDTPYFWSQNGGDIHPQIEGVCPPAKNNVRRKEVRFFSLPYGVMKICKASNSPYAYPVLDRLVDMHAAFITGKLPRIPEKPTLAQIAWLKPYTRGIGPAVTSVCAEIGKCPNTVRSYIRKIRGGESIRLNKTPGKMAYVHKKHRDKYDEAIRLRAGGLKLREISKKTGVLITTISNWTKEKCNTTGGLLTYEQETEQ